MDEDLYQKLITYGLSYVAIRQRSAKEVQDYLHKKIIRLHIPSDMLERVFDRLTELGYINDVAYAQAYIRSESRFHPKGKRYIKMALRQKGVSEACIEDAYKALATEEDGQMVDELELARKAVQKRIHSLNGVSKIDCRSKLYNFLMRKGFESDIISTVIDEMI